MSFFGRIANRLMAPLAKGLTSFSDASRAAWLQRNGFERTAAGYSEVNPATAMNLSVVWACTRIISETLAFLPLNMMQADGEINKHAKDKPLYGALKHAPNEEMTAASFRETQTAQYLLRGNSFARIHRRSGTGEALELEPIPVDAVTVDRERGGEKRLVYVVNVPGDRKTFTIERGKPQDILHLKGISGDGIHGYSVIEVARRSIGTAMATEHHVSQFWANGGRTPYLLKLSQQFKNDSDRAKFRKDWEDTYSSPHRAPILEPWLDYKDLGMSQRDAQVIESRQFSIPEICRWFLVSPHLVGDLARATFSNIEQLSLEFVKFTLQTHINRWEQELHRCVLTPAERSQGYYFKHNVNALLRGDFQTRMSGYATMLQNGIATQNEVRLLEDLDPVPEGNNLHIQLNMQTLLEGALQSQIDAAAKRMAANNSTAKGQAQ